VSVVRDLFWCLLIGLVLALAPALLQWAKEMLR